MVERILRFFRQNIFKSIYYWLFMINYSTDLSDKKVRELIFWRVFMLLFLLFMLTLRILQG